MHTASVGLIFSSCHVVDKKNILVLPTLIPRSVFLPLFADQPQDLTLKQNTLDKSFGKGITSTDPCLVHLSWAVIQRELLTQPYPQLQFLYIF